jgi:hypothetical protein
MVQAAASSAAGMLYADYYTVKDDKLIPNPVTEYQEGSLRDDFNFGPLVLFSSAVLKEAASRMQTNYHFAGYYDLRLKVSQRHKIVHIPEFLYSCIEEDERKSGEKQFDYVDPKTAVCNQWKRMHETRTLKPTNRNQTTLLTG